MIPSSIIYNRSPADNLLKIILIYIFNFTTQYIIIRINIHLGFKAYERLSVDCCHKYYDYVLDFGQTNKTLYKKFIGKEMEVRLEKMGL